MYNAWRQSDFRRMLAIEAIAGEKIRKPLVALARV
jgi:hypothetical protein